MGSSRRRRRARSAWTPQPATQWPESQSGGTENHGRQEGASGAPSAECEEIIAEFLSSLAPLDEATPPQQKVMWADVTDADDDDCPAEEDALYLWYNAEQGVDVPVPIAVEKDARIPTPTANAQKFVLKDGTQEHIMGQAADVPVSPPCTVDQVVDTHFPQEKEERVPAPKTVPQERILKQVVEQAVDMPGFLNCAVEHVVGTHDPHAKEKVVQETKFVPQERDLKQIVEQAAGVPIFPQGRIQKQSMEQAADVPGVLRFALSNTSWIRMLHMQMREVSERLR